MASRRRDYSAERARRNELARSRGYRSLDDQAAARRAGRPARGDQAPVRRTPATGPQRGRSGRDYGAERQRRNVRARERGYRSLDDQAARRSRGKPAPADEAWTWREGRYGLVARVEVEDGAMTARTAARIDRTLDASDRDRPVRVVAIFGNGQYRNLGTFTAGVLDAGAIGDLAAAASGGYMAGPGVTFDVTEIQLTFEPLPEERT